MDIKQSMKILIIDNEVALRRAVREMITKSFLQTATIMEAEGVVSGLKKIEEFSPDIVLLDIEMEDGTGFDLLQQVSNPSFQLIFTTAHNKYAIQAFKFSALDYLLKPIDPAELKLTLDRAISQINKSSLAGQLAVMMQQLYPKAETEKKIVLNDKQSTYYIKISDIIFCEAEGPYTKFYISAANPILISKNLKEYEELLTPYGFVRTHHSYIANPNKIKLYDKTDGGALILEGGYNIPISQRRKDLVMAALSKNNI